MLQTTLRCAAPAVLAALVSATAAAQPAPLSPLGDYRAGIMAGGGLGGTLTVYGVRLSGFPSGLDLVADLGTGASASAFAERRLGSWLFGLSADVNHMSGESGYSSATTLLTAGGVLRRAFPVGSRFILYPGASVGYGYHGDVQLQAQSVSDFEVAAATYLMYGGSVQLSPSTGAWPWLAEVGILASASGGNDDYDTSIAPRLVVRFGLAR